MTIIMLLLRRTLAFRSVPQNALVKKLKLVVNVGMPNLNAARIMLWGPSLLESSVVMAKKVDMIAIARRAFLQALAVKKTKLSRQCWIGLRTAKY